MDELIARLETLRGPDRECDLLIFEAVGLPTEFFGSKIESWSRAGQGAGYTVNTEDGIRHLSAFNAPYYTTSIDAALTLVPYGWWVNLQCHGQYHHAELEYCGPGEIECSEIDTDEVCSRNLPSPALAVCVASLKARAAMALTNQDRHRHDR